LSRSLVPQYAFAFSGQIWNLALDDGNGWLVAEIRDADTRRVSFSTIDLQKNALLWKDLSPDPTWWMGLVGVYNGVLLLHRYADSQRPETSGILAIDVATESTRWKHTDWAFLHTDGHSVALHQTGADQLPVYQKVDIHSGEVISAGPMPPVLEPLRPPSNVRYPWHYTEESPYFQPIALFLGRQLGINPVKAFDYAEFQGLIVVSYYLCEPHSPLTNRIVVLDEQAKVLLHETIATQLTGIGLDTFFIRKSSLIWVREKKELLSYRFI